MDKHEIAEIFEEIAVLLELKGDNPFRIRAYRNAARALLNERQALAKRIEEGTLTEIEGVGDDLADKITELVTTGRLPFYEKLKKSLPAGLLELRQVAGLGGKKIKTLYEKLKIKSIAALKKACESGAVAKLKGFGEKTALNILEGIAHVEAYQKRYLWWNAMKMAEPILKSLKKLKEVKKVEIAGSLRRKLETVGDLDFLVASAQPKSVMQWFTSQPYVERVLVKGSTKSSVRLHGGMQADLRIVSDKEFPFALQYFIGSKEHNIKLRERARARQLSLSEYGLKPYSKKIVAEEGIYQALGLAWIPPELREDRGEIEAAAQGKLPVLVEERDIRGTFHNHTTASDGRSTLEEMVQAAQKLGWEYMGIADHSKSSFQAHGLTEAQQLEQIKLIAKLNASQQFKTFIFSGVECDILPNGTLDVSDHTLKKFDYVVVSVHSAFRQDEKTMTKRLIRAIEHPLTTMVGHVTGRLLLQRGPYPVNLAQVIDACIANNKIMELNANPNEIGHGLEAVA